MKTTTFRFDSALLVASCLVGPICGCSDDTNPIVPAYSKGPLYALSTITFSPDFSSSSEHVAFSNSLDVGGKVYDELSIEITGENSSIWPSYRLGEWFLADSATGQIQKYTIHDDGTMKQSQKLSFTAYGVSSLYWCIVIVHSSTKAYLFDELTFQGFVWDPSSMTITSRVDLAAKFQPQDGNVKYTVWRERTPIRVGDRYFASYKYFDPASQAVLSRSGMIGIDAATDEFTVVEHPTCGGLLNSVLGSDGMIYSSTGITGVAAYHLGQAGASAPCMTKFDPEKLVFDETYTKTDIGSLAGSGMVAGGLAGQPDGTAYLQVLEPALVPQGFPPAPLVYTGLRIWQTYRLDDLANPQTLTKVDVPVMGGVVFPFVIDGRTFISDADNPNGKSWLWDFSVDPPQKGIELDGWGYTGIHVR